VVTDLLPSIAQLVARRGRSTYSMPLESARLIGTLKALTPISFRTGAFVNGPTAPASARLKDLFIQEFAQGVLG